jgi:hypothetical protein
MDSATARDYIHTYPRISAILTDYFPKPRHGFSEDDVYTILEEVLGIRDSRIAFLEKHVKEINEACEHYIGAGRLSEALKVHARRF